MAVPWEGVIKATKRLTVFPTTTVSGGPWGSVFKRAIQEFNQMSKTLKFGVTLAVSSTAPASNGSGANVQFDTASGTVQFNGLGTGFSLTVNGDGMIGHTQQVIESFPGQPDRIRQAFIFVPSTPRINAGTGRIVGDGVKLCMAVHEFIHACGIAQNEHSTGDLFEGFPSLSAGSQPQDDKLTFGQKHSPPLFLVSATVKKIHDNWK